MPITIDYTPEEARLLQKHAMAQNVSVEDFIHTLSVKALQNAEYLKKLDRAFQQIEDGKCKPHELIEVDG